MKRGSRFKVQGARFVESSRCRVQGSRDKCRVRVKVQGARLLKVRENEVLPSGIDA
jgi:hypothetical protein